MLIGTTTDDHYSVDAAVCPDVAQWFVMTVNDAVFNCWFVSHKQPGSWPGVVYK